MPHDSNLLKLSVIIPVRNEEKYIQRTLTFLANQDYPKNKVEILVIDGESDDRTAEIVTDFARQDNRIRLISNPKRLSSAARAIGVEQATGDFVSIIDGHVFIDNDQLFKNTALLFAEKKVSVLSRPQFLDTPDNSFFQKAVSIARKSYFGHGLDSTIYLKEDAYVDPTSSGASYSRDVFEKAGNFDDRFDACEDVEFNYRVAKQGYRSFSSLKLAVYYYPRDSVKGLFRQLSRYGTGRFRLACKHPETLSLSTLIPFLFVAGTILLAIFLIFSKLSGVVLIASIVFYLGLNFTNSIGLGIIHGLRYIPVLPIIFLTIHWSLGWGFLKELGRAIIGKCPDFRQDKRTN